MNKIILLVVTLFFGLILNGQNALDISVKIKNSPNILETFQNTSELIFEIKNEGESTIPSTFRLFISSTDKGMITPNILPLPKNLDIGESITIKVPLIHHQEVVNEINLGIIIKLISEKPEQIEFGKELENNAVNIRVTSANNNEILIYPNPTAGNDKIYFNQKLDLELFSIDGKLILDIKNSDNLDISDLPNGIYYVKTNHPLKAQYQKIIIN